MTEMALITVRCIHCGAPTGGVVTSEQAVRLTAEESTCLNCKGILAEPRNTEVGSTCPNCNESDGIYIRSEETVWFNARIDEDGIVRVGERTDSETQEYWVRCSHCDATRTYNDIYW